jgi:protoporphyrin/coproporphyrin ferrochelatase
MGGVFDAVLLLSFGGPEGPGDVLPFLENVTRGRGVPRERLLDVAQHYQHFGGVSPINDQNRALLAAIRADFAAHGLDLPVYWGNRNWHPYAEDAVGQMRADGVRSALAFATSAYASYSGCRQYLDDIGRAVAAAGEGAPAIAKLRHYYDHPGFLAPHTDAVAAALATLTGPDRRIVFTAHSIPVAMNDTSGPGGDLYRQQLLAAAALVASAAAPGLPWSLVWQSRSGPPQVPWLEPDVNDHLADLAAEGATDVVVSPIGFVSDHLEVLWDLDNEAAGTAAKLGLGFARAATPGTDPRFVAMVRELVLERCEPGAGPVRELSGLGRNLACGSEGCCPAPRRRPS